MARAVAPHFRGGGGQQAFDVRPLGGQQTAYAIWGAGLGTDCTYVRFLRALIVRVARTIPTRRTYDSYVRFLRAVRQWHVRRARTCGTYVRVGRVVSLLRRHRGRSECDICPGVF